jgi:hypothetical protein
MYFSKAASSARHWFSMVALMMPLSVSMMQPAGGTSEQSVNWIRTDLEKYRRLTREIGFQPD